MKPKGKKEPKLSSFLVKFLENNILSRVNSCKNILRNPLGCVRILAAAISPWLGKMFAN